MKPNQIYNCEKCQVLLKSPVHSYIRKPCGCENGFFESYIKESRLEKVEKQKADLLEAAKEVNRYFNESRYNQYGDTTESYTNAYNKLEEAISRATEGK